MKPIKSIKTKLLIRITIAFILLSMVLQAIVLKSFRSLTLEGAEDKAKTVAALTRDTITSFMILGVYDKRDVFLDRLKYAYGLKELKIIRGASVVKQFGESVIKGQSLSALESEALQVGEQRDSLNERWFATEVQYALVIPYRADSDQKVRCISCHEAREGELLGAISLVMDLSKQKQRGMYSMSFMVIISLIFSMGTLYIIYVFFKPYTELFQRLRSGFQRAQSGDFSEAIDVPLLDEAGDVANGFNSMSDSLSQTLSDISGRVSLLIGYESSKSGNAITDTAKTVDSLVKIYYFKRTIEKDASKLDIFLRFQQILKEMGITTFCIYELNSEQDVMSILSAEGLSRGASAGDDSDWDCYCSEEIFSNTNECRAKRTGGIVDSGEFASICLSFTPPLIIGNVRLCHYCIPLYVGGRVGYVIALIYPAEDSGRLHSVIPYVKSYLKEGESVIEAKTFMEMLREQSLVDQLTRLYNRRYLQETGPKFSAQALRRKTNLGILLLDIDHFKQVNDTFGHDVGDIVLRTVAGLIKDAVRESDIVVRYGGEEILVVLVDIVGTGSLDVAEKIRKAIEHSTIEHSSGILKKTVSIGVSEFPVHSNNFWQCVKYADVAMYRAKHDGRNRAYIFSRDMLEDAK
ncbi:diguanylate cyclase [Candidatus Magnetobacterium bavaricum]|uniref:diguanylate cyclase n=1 Tax=Candidatus Magnetobacterium bavaricum TaxID=29290 RepID=A0A0F3GNQ2_9BACT|nr:diguanylate cyclase [Candidatus Magnetobacterium bavaricum]